ncbi:MAG: hypothetical protein CFH05_01614 [Alphaproteobacteria bacterium MarineAlpha3_Bin4]|nr:MAG: hypothetical protein CFH05_01614 [Alphaproteobacteria bacterium MarineAlpha3_Bin4]
MASSLFVRRETDALEIPSKVGADQKTAHVERRDRARSQVDMDDPISDAEVEIIAEHHSIAQHNSDIEEVIHG